MTRPAPLLDVAGLSVVYEMRHETVRAVDGMDFHVERGEVVGLTGASASGKSSAALALLRLARPPGRVTSERLLFDGVELADLGDGGLRALRGARASIIVQNPRGALHPMISVGRQVASVARAHLDLDNKQARKLAISMLERVGMNDPARRYSSYPHEMSGGMAQRVLIAMATICGPELVIADEPSSGLDVTTQRQVLDDLLRTVREAEASVVFVTQNLGIVANYCDRVVVMDAGRVVERSTVAEFFDGAAEGARRDHSARSGVGNEPSVVRTAR